MNDSLPLEEEQDFFRHLKVARDQKATNLNESLNEIADPSPALKPHIYFNLFKRARVDSFDEDQLKTPQIGLGNVQGFDQVFNPMFGVLENDLQLVDDQSLQLMESPHRPSENQEQRSYWNELPSENSNNSQSCSQQSKSNN